MALLQETRPPPLDVGISLHDINDHEEWPNGRAGRVAVVRLSDRFEVEFIEKSFTKTPNLLAPRESIRGTWRNSSSFRSARTTNTRMLTCPEK